MAAMAHVADLLPPEVPVAVAKLIGRVLGEHAHGVPRRRERRTGRRRCGSTARTRQGRARPDGWPRRRPGWRRSRWIMVTMARCGSTPGRDWGKVGSAGQAAVDLEHRACRPPLFDPAAKGGREPRPRHNASVRFGSAFETITGARIVSPPSSTTPSPGRMAATGTPAASTAPASRAASASSERHPAHAALDVSPRPGHALERAGSVHQMDRRRSGIARSGVGADEALTMQGRPQPFVAYIAFDHLGDRSFEQDLNGFGVTGEQLLELRASRCVTDPCVPVPSAEGAPDPAEQRLVAAVALDVHRRQLGHGRGAAHRILPKGDGGPVGERAP